MEVISRMAESRTPFVQRLDESERLWAVDGSLSRMLLPPDPTGGTHAIVMDQVVKNEGIPSHRHPGDDETFYIVDGELEFFFEDGSSVEVRTGDVLFQLGQTAHSFRVNSDEARYLIITTPRHYAFYRAIGTPAQGDGLPPQQEMDMDKVMAACEAYGVELLGPPPGMKT